MAEVGVMAGKVLVTGASGMLGSALCPELRSRGFQVIATDWRPDDRLGTLLDVRDYEEVKRVVDREAPEIVMHLAAETDVDRCEIEPDHAMLTNAMGTEHVALACRRADILMVYIGTAGVFDGMKHTPYIEFDLPNPVNVYGRSKWEGEKLVAGLLRRYFIFRASWMVGGGPRDKKFVRKIAELIANQDEVAVVNDKWGTPTFTFDLARAMVDLIQTTDRYGLYHLGNQGSCTRFELAQEVARCLGREQVRIRPIPSAAFPLPAPRARSEMLENYKLRLLGEDKMPPWQESLVRYLREWPVGQAVRSGG
ncbi:MAG: dTDP-4-dehydrorhamnose reductase [Candidatus Rokubacteria bacterium]|nr:dTDP-4-dehydrorhamnose reductase [Candidatus Rokubacteria bacterium]